MTPLRFLDTNILVRYIADDNADLSPRCTALFEQIATAELDGLLSMTVLFESAYVLAGIYNLDRVTIAQAMLALVSTPGIKMIGNEKSYVDRTLSLYMSNPRLSFADCYHAALALDLCNGEIYTFDQDFGRVSDLTRLEPAFS